MKNKRVRERKGTKTYPRNRNGKK